MHPTSLSRTRAFALGLLVLCACSPEPPPVVTLQDAASVDEEVVALVREHERLAREAPSDAERRATLAMVYEANELWHEAARGWEDALALEDGGPLWRYHLAVCARQAGDAERALTLLQQVVAEQPELAAARQRLGEMLLERDDHFAAATQFEAAMQEAPAHPAPLVSLAEALLRDDQPERAAELCRRALVLAPGYKRAHYSLGLALRELGRMEEAERELGLGLNAKKEHLPDPLSARIESFRTSYTVRLIEAASLEKAGRHDAAVRILERVVRKHPDDVNALGNLAASLLELGRVDEALAHLERARQLDPEPFGTYINLAAAELARGRFPQALAYADQAIERAPTVGRTFFVRAKALGLMGRWGEAYEALKTCISLDAANGLAHIMLGDVCLQLELHAEAAQHYATATRQLPGEFSAFTGLALAFVKLGQLEEARAPLARARQLAPQHPLVARVARELADAGG